MIKTQRFMTGLALGLALTLTACFEAEDLKPAADVDGNCTAVFVSDYNSTENSVKEAEKDRANSEAIASALLSCENFESQYQNLSEKACKAGGGQSIDGLSLKARCEKLSFSSADSTDLSTDGADAQVPKPEEGLKDFADRTAKNKEKGPITQVGDEVALKDYKASPILFDILSHSNIDEVKTKQREDKVFFQGKVGTLASFREAFNQQKSAFCGIYDTEDTLLVNGAQLDVVEIKEEPFVSKTGKEPMGRIVIAFRDLKLYLWCVKKEVTPFTLKEIREALKGTFEVRLGVQN